MIFISKLCLVFIIINYVVSAQNLIEENNKSFSQRKNIKLKNIEQTYPLKINLAKKNNLSNRKSKTKENEIINDFKRSTNRNRKKFGSKKLKRRSKHISRKRKKQHKEPRKEVFLDSKTINYESMFIF